MLRSKKLTEFVLGCLDKGYNYQEKVSEEFEGLIPSIVEKLELNSTFRDFMRINHDNFGCKVYVTTASIIGEVVPIRLYIDNSSHAITLVFRDHFINYDGKSQYVSVYRATREMKETFREYARRYDIYLQELALKLVG